MTDTLPSPRVDAARLAEIRALYTELLGFVPPRIEARVSVGSRVDPEGLEMQETMREHTWEELWAVAMGSEIIKKMADDEGASA